MKHQGPFRPEPFHSRRVYSWLAISLTLLTIGLATGIAILHRRGYISDGLMPSMICFVVAVAMGAFIAVDIEQQASRRPYQHYDEVDPPPEIYSAWPLTIQLTNKTGKPEPARKWKGRLYRPRKPGP
ncbi:hypothetical protein [Sphingobium sp. EM0848]|uniref:hypothetical protein n=1 Tax=Sphingobium sp. EM0848 TaxID=2743473 RepID=UPI00159C4BC3|nr:hypothetical protein [Sphingobium sp. EM0848]